MAMTAAQSKAAQRAYWVDEMGYCKDCMQRPSKPNSKRCEPCTTAEVTRQREARQQRKADRG